MGVYPLRKSHLEVIYEGPGKNKPHLICLQRKTRSEGAALGGLCSNFLQKVRAIVDRNATRIKKKTRRENGGGGK